MILEHKTNHEKNTEEIHSIEDVLCSECDWIFIKIGRMEEDLSTKSLEENHYNLRS